MALIDFKNVFVDFPIYNASGRSLKKKIMKVATGGVIGEDPEGKVIVRALDDVSFRFVDGDRVGILGHNGAGKSTLLRVLSKVYEPTAGQVTISGKIGSLIDITLGVDPECTGLENIFLRAAYLGINKKQVKQNLEDIIEFSELGDFIDMPLRTYSTGMHLRLAFSVSTILRSDILLMDEWLSVGDENFRVKAEERMKSLVDNSSVLILASHSESLIKTMCNKVIWMEHGKVKACGEPDLICSNYFK